MFCLYLYPYGENHQLTSHSPCLDTGVTFNWMSDSSALNNTRRILFGQTDRGCYEYDGSTESFLPLVEPFSPTGWVAYDEPVYTAYGGRNINTVAMEATLTTHGITSNLTVSLSGNYDWSIDPIMLQPDITNTFTVTGWNTTSNLSEQTFSVIREASEPAPLSLP